MKTLSHLSPQSILRFFPSGICAIDLETTGLSPMSDSMIELGAALIDGEGKIQTFETLIKPERPIPKKSTDIHGITDEDVANAPGLHQALQDFLNLNPKGALLAHNAQFDIGFLAQGLRIAALPLPNLPIHCSLRLSRSLAPGLERYNLKELCDRFQIPLKRHHRALDDALACLSLCMALLDQQGEHRQRALEESLKKSFLFPLTALNHKTPLTLTGHLSEMPAWVQEKRIIEFIYKGGSVKGPRAIFPQALLPFPQGVMLHGLCLISGQYKSFAVRKIKNALLPEGEELQKWQKKMQEHQIKRQRG